MGERVKVKLDSNDWAFVLRAMDFARSNRGETVDDNAYDIAQHSYAIEALIFRQTGVHWTDTLLALRRGYNGPG